MTRRRLFLSPAAPLGLPRRLHKRFAAGKRVRVRTQTRAGAHARGVYIVCRVMRLREWFGSGEEEGGARGWRARGHFQGLEGRGEGRRESAAARHGNGRPNRKQKVGSSHLDNAPPRPQPSFLCPARTQLAPSSRNALVGAARSCVFFAHGRGEKRKARPSAGRPGSWSATVASYFFSDGLAALSYLSLS